MRIRIACPQKSHREFSGTLFEPILAEAAAQYMVELSDVPEVLAKYASNGLVEKGESEELAARLLLITAYDNALKGHRKPIILSLVALYLNFRFFRELFGEDNCKTLFKSRCTTSVHATRSQVLLFPRSRHYTPQYRARHVFRSRSTRLYR